LKKEKTYRLLGIDPGTNILGYAVIEVQEKKLRLLDIGTVQLQKMQDQQLKLKHIFERLQTIIDIYQPEEMAIEAPFYGKNVQSMLKLGRAQGVAMAAGITRGVDITEYSPRKIKQSITGKGNASKEQVAAMLAQILSTDLHPYDLDATDALAAAVCHHFQHKSPLSPKKQYNDWSSFLKDNPDRVE
jgi:crossover junction endodeoxyribonuclease RuvC